VPACSGCRRLGPTSGICRIWLRSTPFAFQCLDGVMRLEGVDGPTISSTLRKPSSP